MNLEGILSIAGKPGLYKLVAQSRSGIIVESLLDGKRIPVSQAANISALSDIAIFTWSEEKPLSAIFKAIREKENGPTPVKHKDSGAKLEAYFAEVEPDYDTDRVYASDIKKVIQWYNLLEGKGLLDGETEDETEVEQNSETESETISDSEKTNDEEE